MCNTAMAFFQIRKNNWLNYPGRILMKTNNKHYDMQFWNSIDWLLNLQNNAYSETQQRNGHFTQLGKKLK